MQNLGGDPNDPFRIFPEVEAMYQARLDVLRQLAEERKKEEALWRQDNKDRAEKLDRWFSDVSPVIDWSKVEQKPDQATRAASASILGVLAQQVENMVVASADLSNSDKTDGFLKKTRALTRGDFGGAFLQPGVAELRDRKSVV